MIFINIISQNLRINIKRYFSIISHNDSPPCRLLRGVSVTPPAGTCVTIIRPTVSGVARPPRPSLRPSRRRTAMNAPTSWLPVSTMAFVTPTTADYSATFSKQSNPRCYRSGPCLCYIIQICTFRHFGENKIT